ncbi:four helix bundle protein [Deminuibacter soli]|uniref:Four helix bundle protein n=1 Tax=Deminuibacter soli TaxID=2291815 RepID=A0A3E1NFE7_9BACT|nr:four helix bundle protein [Deminuibacter soli]RFM26703.1 four helix bundle protein [Deminuibacter soli]
MILSLPHKQLDVYKMGRLLVVACYKLAAAFPPEEKFAMSQQLRRAALSVQLNIAEGSSRKSLQERKRFYEIARGSIIEIDAAIEIAVALQFTTTEQLQETGALLLRCYQMLTKMIYNNL